MAAPAEFFAPAEFDLIDAHALTRDEYYRFRRAAHGLPRVARRVLIETYDAYEAMNARVSMMVRNMIARDRAFARRAIKNMCQDAR